MPISDLRSAILDRAVQILVDMNREVAYRDLHSSLMAAFPNLSRIEVSDLVGELVTQREDKVWRPRPGFFAPRPADWVPVHRATRSARSANTTESKRWTRNPLPNRVENLQRIGFEHVGKWVLEEGQPVARYDRPIDPNQSLIAYVINGSVYAVLLRSAARNNRTEEAIHRCLGTNREVQIYAFTHENASDSLGNELVERMQPPWNESRRL